MIRYGIAPKGGLVHIVHKVTEGPAARISWKCNRGFGTFNAVVLDDPGDRVRCRVCEAAKDDTDELRVYVARCGDMVKVGCSSQPGLRIHSLGGTPLAVVPGGYDLERRVLDSIPSSPVHGREWFPVDAEADVLAALRGA
jgi:hypothetical protein